MPHMKAAELLGRAGPGREHGPGPRGRRGRRPPPEARFLSSSFGISSFA